jgi:hypothetical protein
MLNSYWPTPLLIGFSATLNADILLDPFITAQQLLIGWRAPMQWIRMDLFDGQQLLIGCRTLLHADSYWLTPLITSFDWLQDPSACWPLLDFTLLITTSDWLQDPSARWHPIGSLCHNIFWLVAGPLCTLTSYWLTLLITFSYWLQDPSACWLLLAHSTNNIFWLAAGPLSTPTSYWLVL